MKTKMIPALSIALCASAFAAPQDAALSTISGASMLKQITRLASDEFEGRGPATHGETVTINYLEQEFKKLGLAPGNPDGSYFQRVPLMGVTSTPALSYSGKGKATALTFQEDYVARSWLLQASVDVKNSELVFVGYGVQAPEFNWDDYKGMDLRGKTLVMLINDPQVMDPKHPDKLDNATFGGAAMTYYGRWTYKYEIAKKMGAAAALIIHETKPAAYPWAVVRTGAVNEGFVIKTDKDDPGNPTVSGWIQLNRAKEMLAAAGYDFDALKAASSRRDFKPVALGLTMDITVKNSWREVPSNNVVAKIEGSDPRLKDDYVIYSAHWDHFGMDEKLPGPRTRQIYHGAQDNASGVAAVLELAKAYKALPQAPKRSVLFLVPTAEERGLLGAYYYAANPLYPLARTTIDINMDMMNVLGKTRDVAVSGFGRSNTDDWVAKVAKTQGRHVVSANAEAGLYFRSDHFPFAKQGVPVLYIETGEEYIGKPKAFKKQKNDEYQSRIYHKVDDVVNPHWDMSGAVQEVQLLFQVGYDAAQGNYTPAWKAGAEFKALRDAMK